MVYSELKNGQGNRVVHSIHTAKRAATAKANYLNTHDVIGIEYWVSEKNIIGSLQVTATKK